MSERARLDLIALRGRLRANPLLGCSLVAHRDLGFCAGCQGCHNTDELDGWRLLAMAERGIPDQPFMPRGPASTCPTCGYVGELIGERLFERTSTEGYILHSDRHTGERSTIHG